MSVTSERELGTSPTSKSNPLAAMYSSLRPHRRNTPAPRPIMSSKSQTHSPMPTIELKRPLKATESSSLVLRPAPSWSSTAQASSSIAPPRDDLSASLSSSLPIPQPNMGFGRQSRRSSGVFNPPNKSSRYAQVKANPLPRPVIPKPLPSTPHPPWPNALSSSSSRTRHQRKPSLTLVSFLDLVDSDSESDGEERASSCSSTAETDIDGQDLFLSASASSASSSQGALTPPLSGSSLNLEYATNNDKEASPASGANRSITSSGPSDALSRSLSRSERAQCTKEAAAAAHEDLGDEALKSLMNAGGANCDATHILDAISLHLGLDEEDATGFDIRGDDELADHARSIQWTPMAGPHSPRSVDSALENFAFSSFVLGGPIPSSDKREAGYDTDVPAPISPQSASFWSPSPSPTSPSMSFFSSPPSARDSLFLALSEEDNERLIFGATAEQVEPAFTGPFRLSAPSLASSDSNPSSPTSLPRSSSSSESGSSTETETPPGVDPSRRPSIISIISSASDATLDASTGLPRRRSSVYDATFFETVISPMVDLFPAPPSSFVSSFTSRPGGSGEGKPSVPMMDTMMRASPAPRTADLPTPVAFPPPANGSFIPSRTPPHPPHHSPPPPRAPAPALSSPIPPVPVLNIKTTSGKSRPALRTVHTTRDSARVGGGGILRRAPSLLSPNRPSEVQRRDEGIELELEADAQEVFFDAADMDLSELDFFDTARPRIPSPPEVLSPSSAYSQDLEVAPISPGLEQDDDVWASYFMTFPVPAYPSSAVPLPSRSPSRGAGSRNNLEPVPEEAEDEHSNMGLPSTM